MQTSHVGFFVEGSLSATRIPKSSLYGSSGLAADDTAFCSGTLCREDDLVSISLGSGLFWRVAGTLVCAAEGISPGAPVDLEAFEATGPVGELAVRSTTVTTPGCAARVWEVAGGVTGAVLVVGARALSRGGAFVLSPSDRPEEEGTGALVTGGVAGAAATGHVFAVAADESGT